MAGTAMKLPVQSEKSLPATPGEKWTPLEHFRRDIDRFFDEFRPFDWRLPVSRPLLGLDMPRLRSPEWAVAPAVDVVEKDNEYEITAEMPGIDEKNIDVKLANRTLTIRGEKQEDKEEKGKDYHLSERRYGSFQRSFALPEGVDVNGIEASFTKGVLTVRLPKSEDARKAEKKISVKSA